jgi:hypothetical protein
MPSIFDAPNMTPADREWLADTIVTAVFMGMLEDRLDRSLPVWIGYGGGYDPYDYPYPTEVDGKFEVMKDKKLVKDEDVASHAELKRQLAERFGSSRSELLTIGPAEKWVDKSKGREFTDDSSFVITGARGSVPRHQKMSTPARERAVSCQNSNLDFHRRVALVERGAYYGVADLAPQRKGEKGEVYGPYGTTGQVFFDSKERWMNPSHGWIRGRLADPVYPNAVYNERPDVLDEKLKKRRDAEVPAFPSNARMDRTPSARKFETMRLLEWERILKWETDNEKVKKWRMELEAERQQLEKEGILEKEQARTDEYVVGYCHGMIFAEHICFINAPPWGTAYEISMNRQTTKNASCLGCATFMFANDMPPSWMHLGGAESWVPLPQVADEPQANESKGDAEFSYSVHFPNRCAAAARVMNDTWRSAVARWMKKGIQYARLSPAYKTLDGQLAGKDVEKKGDCKTMANWFLDALTIHGRDDIIRIISVLRGNIWPVPKVASASPPVGKDVETKHQKAPNELAVVASASQSGWPRVGKDVETKHQKAPNELAVIASAPQSGSASVGGDVKNVQTKPGKVRCSSCGGPGQVKRACSRSDSGCQNQVDFCEVCAGGVDKGVLKALCGRH